MSNEIIFFYLVLMSPLLFDGVLLQIVAPVNKAGGVIPICSSCCY